MFELRDSYLISYLNEGNSLKIIFMAHNSRWPYLEQLSDYYENCSVDVYGRGVSYIRMSEMVGSKKQDDCDLIIYQSTFFYDENEFTNIKELAFSISSFKNKKVSIGYSYYIPEEIRYDKKLRHGLCIVSVLDGNLKEEVFNMEDITSLELVEETLLKHNGIKKSNRRVREQKN